MPCQARKLEFLSHTPRLRGQAMGLNSSQNSPCLLQGVSDANWRSRNAIHVPDHIRSPRMQAICRGTNHPCPGGQPAPCDDHPELRRCLQRRHRNTGSLIRCNVRNFDSARRMLDTRNGSIAQGLIQSRFETLEQSPVRTRCRVHVGIFLLADNRRLGGIIDPGSG